MIKARVRRTPNEILWHILALPFLNRYRIRMHFADCYVVEGRTKGSNCELRAFVFGSTWFLHYLADLVYSEVHQIKRIGLTNLEKATLLSKEFGPAVVFADFLAVYSDAMSMHFLVLPDLTWSLDITPPIEVLISKMKRLRRRCIRAVQEEDYRYEYTNSAERFDFFYNRMYVPYTSKMHGKAAQPRSEEEAKKIFKSGGLFLVKSEGEYVSGIMFSRKRKIIQCKLLAMNPDTNREIAGQAALYGLINWAKQEGCTEIDYGEGTPFAGDGLFAYKRTWGMQVRPLSELAFGIRIQTLSNGVLDFLSTNPLVFRFLDGLVILVFLQTRSVDVKALYSRYYTPGLDRLVVVHQVDDARIDETSLSDNLLEKSIANLLPSEELQKVNYRADVFRFSDINARYTCTV